MSSGGLETECKNAATAIGNINEYIGMCPCYSDQAVFLYLSCISKCIAVVLGATAFPANFLPSSTVLERPN